MTIVPLKKVSIVGVLADKERVLEAVQAFGAMHLIPLRPAQKELEAVPSGTGRDAVNALRWLIDCPAPRRAVTDKEGFDVDEVTAAAIANRQALLDAEDRRAALLKRIKDVRPWGEFSFAGLEEVGGYRLWFYVVPHNRFSAIDPAGKVLEIVHSDRRSAYVVLLSPQEPPVDAMPVPRVHVGEHSLSELERQLEAIEVLLEDLWAERRALTKWRVLMAAHLAEAQDRSARRRAALETADHERVFAMQGWLAAERVPEVGQLAEVFGTAVIVEDADRGDDVPTLLANRPELAGGELLVEFYQTPSYRDWDPSSIVYVSFILFFGMIMTDVGYGLLLLGLLYVFRKRFETSENGRRMLVMGYWLMASTALFGVLTGSYFGLTPPEGSLLAHLKIMNLKNVQAMMKLTLTIGVVHVVLANLMSSRHAKTRSRQLQPIGWCLVAVGGLTAFLGADIRPLQVGGLALAGAGLVMVGVYGSDREITSPKTAFLRVFDGLGSVFRLTNMFSDVLSYMRLFALGLAAASLAETINTLSGQLVHAAPGIGVLIAFAVLVIGHAINIGLGLIAGVVHGLRLNVIEFFNWGLKDEGKAFRPFRKQETGQ
ncbi:V-type ATP synthase subunit I [Stappia sp. F7233]|uniref:V-type ATP synthase subunit I n=1 Tax=Stappia albiluteola TaxID=2758565 RepID=A0A839ACT4_9HYPH|nr:V-type ATP synthase subunit I [Stappia albiluteola]MBA5777560.1 V-type ATP synthase subunit I [Stappia albiluteola]